MKITHFLSPNNHKRKTVKEASFLISNRAGDYLWLDKYPKSRYDGWFCRLSNKMYKVLEGIEIDGAGSILEIQNGFNHIERKRDDVEEIFYLSENSHVLVYELNEKRKVNLFFDARESYSSAEGLGYEIKEERGVFVLKFANNLFLGIKCDELNNIEEFFERYYEYDQKRNSPPFTKKVCKGVSLHGKRFVFAVAESRKEVEKELKKIFLKSVLKETEKVDVLCAKRALENLVVENEPGLYAGLPWFFHFWPRDEAISLKALTELNPQKGKEIFFKLLERGSRRGPGGVVNVDAIGWTFKRLDDVIPFLDNPEKELVSRRLKKYMEEFLWSYTEDGFTVNKDHETWMDSLGRDGARIEIQAMKLNMYKVAVALAKKKTEKDFYRKLELEMKKKVKKAFFDGEILADGYYPRKKITDKTIRPNIFIAAYIYPELLSKKEWIRCFENALIALWLPWGGIATVDKRSEQFKSEHTGEVAESYHQGDSWFFLNNLTALVLYRADKRKFSFYIDKIMKASEEEILWKGAIGCHTEVSSAKELTSEGCTNQAWSSALYLEAKREIKESLI